jgi:hypothetical protein
VREVVRRWTLSRAGTLPARPRARRYVRRSAAPRRRPTGAISDRARSAATSSNPRAGTRAQERASSTGRSQPNSSRDSTYPVPEIDASGLRPVATAGGAGDRVRSSGEGMRDRKRDRKRGGKRARKRDRKRGRPRPPGPEIDASEFGSGAITGATGNHVRLADEGTRTRKRARKRSRKRTRKRARKRSRVRTPDRHQIAVQLRMIVSIAGSTIASARSWLAASGSRAPWTPSMKRGCRSRALNSSAR